MLIVYFFVFYGGWYGCLIKVNCDLNVLNVFYLVVFSNIKLISKIKLIWKLFLVWLKVVVIIKGRRERLFCVDEFVRCEILGFLKCMYRIWFFFM